eukprot:m.267903 g.267903  ORF g.267903 m.267903 type:complete len:184 (-) comp26794_c0_seq3:148-699(-)
MAVTARSADDAMECRLFVGCKGDFTGICEMVVDFSRVVVQRAAADAAAAAASIAGERRNFAEDEAQPDYTVVRKIPMPESGPRGYRGPNSAVLRGDLIYVNCSLYAYVVRLNSDGTTTPIWSVNHAEGDTNEMWDTASITVDDSGACYVSTATEDERYTCASGRSVVCIKRFHPLAPAAAADE